jgi:NAD(P)-dependent dehydrogenase (short-subunit alcohol dehydrogenase family)
VNEERGSGYDTVVWITGATQGLGSGLARTCPYAGARVINLSRSPHPDLENVAFDLTRPETWSAVRESFRRHLAGFTGSRAIFIHNAYYNSGAGFAGEVDEEHYRNAVMGNAAAPLVLADSFLREVKPGYESGLVLISSAAARMPFEGGSVYGAAKAGVEQWVRVVRRERARRGTGPWVVAVRPGFVDSPSLRKMAALDPHMYPISPAIREGIDNGETLTPDEAARQIWAALPPAGDESVLLFGAPPSGVDSKGRPRQAAG